MEDDVRPTCIVAAGNTYKPCERIVSAKGYALDSEMDGTAVIFTARKGDVELAAYSPVEVLGLIAMWETYGDDWQDVI